MTRSAKKLAVDLIQFCDDGIYLIRTNKTKTRVADPIFVPAFATSDPGTPKEEAFTQIKFMKRWSRLSEQNLRVDKWSVCRG